MGRPLAYWQSGGTLVSRASGPLPDWAGRALLETFKDQDPVLFSDLQAALQAQAEWVRCMDRNPPVSANLTAYALQGVAGYARVSG